MAGLDLRIGAGANAHAGPPPGPRPTTAGAAAFGSAAAPRVSGAEALVPNDAFGIGFWVGVAAIGLLVFVRYSLPA